MGRVRIAYRGREMRETYLRIMAASFPAAAVDRKRAVWDWLFDAPFATETHPGRLLTVEKDGTPVGASFLLPSRFVIDGSETSAVLPLATVVHPDHLGAGLALIKGIAEHLPGGLSIGQPNSDRLMKAHQRYGLITVAPRMLHRRLYRPGRVLARRARLPTPLAAMLDIAWRPSGWIGQRQGQSGRAARILPVDRFDAEYDQAWKRVMSSLPIAQVRNSRYLNWRYVDMPVASYRRAALRRGGRLAGYVAWRIEDGSRGRVCQIADILAYDNDRESYRLLLHAVDCDARQQRCDFAELSLAGGAALSDAVARAGFGLSKATLPLALQHDDPRMAARLSQLVPSLHFCRGDHDEDY